MTIAVSTLPGFAYCSNDLNNSVNGRSLLVLASVGAQDLKLVAPSAISPQNAQEPYPSFLQQASVGGVPGGNGGQPIGGAGTTTYGAGNGVAPTAGGFNLGETVA
jgi:hypothetical protein